MNPLIKIPLISAACLLLWAFYPASAQAHGFGERYDLPVPLWLYIVGAGAAVAFSFAVIGLFLRARHGRATYPRLNLLRWRPFRGLVHPAPVQLVRLISVTIFVLLLAVGFGGDQEPTNNVAPTIIWVIWWVGLAYVSALAGNLWALINPWTALFQWAELLYQNLNPGRQFSLRRAYPDALGVWPGLLLFFAFAWAEMVYQDSAVPVSLARMAVVYSIITWAGMFAFGKDVWLRQGEAFSLVFGFLARFAPTELRVEAPATCHQCEGRCVDQDGLCVNCPECFRRAPAAQRQLNLRPFAVGLLRHEVIAPSVVALVLLLLSTVTFDGFTATPLWADIHDNLYSTIPSSSGIGTLGLFAFPLLFTGVYLIAAWLMATASGASPPVGDMARAFVYSLIPIALAYHLAHFFSFLLVQGQLLIPLASDPFGAGWDLFGTVDYRVNIAVVNARIAWFVAVAAIVVGHIISVYLAHVIALRTFQRRAPALRSQFPMLALMVGYTMLSLWILAQPIVETGG